MDVYIYIYVCVFVCVCVYSPPLGLTPRSPTPFTGRAQAACRRLRRIRRRAQARAVHTIHIFVC